MSISEIKFIVTEATAAELCEWARVELDADPNAANPGSDNYRITTLYFDTQGFDLFFRRRSHARAEFRIRSYNEGGTVFLERKLRVRGHVLKRRSEVLLVDLPQTSRQRGKLGGPLVCPASAASKPASSVPACLFPDGADKQVGGCPCTPYH